MTNEDAREAARERLKENINHPAEPQLSDPEIEKCLDKAKLALIWTASTAFKVGETVQPTVPNGHRYKCVMGGTSGAAEPDWPKSKASVTGDGASDPQLRWQEDGPAYPELYDDDTAACEGWKKKSTKTATMADMSGPVGDLKASQIHKQCLEMMAVFAPKGIS